MVTPVPPSGVAILGNTRLPNYQHPTTNAVDFGPHWIGTADFLGHGASDVVVLEGALSLLPGAPKGKFQAQPTVDMTQSAVGNPVLADFNGDGHLDAAVPAAYSIQILLGKGNRLFGSPATVTAGPSPSGLISGDFNGDGKPDLAVGDNQTHLIYILLGNGDGTFSMGASYAVGGVCCFAIAAVDLNLDGKLDLVVVRFTDSGDGAATAQVLLGKGDGTFGTPLPISATLSGDAFALSDFNGDGIPDLVASDALLGPELFIGNGNGTFQNPVALYTRGPACGIGAGDFNGDAKLDLAFFNPSSYAVILLGNGNGTFQTGQTFYAETGGNLLISDLNGDGHLDLLTGGDQNAKLIIYLGNGDGTFTQQTGYVRCVAIGYCGAAIGDLNGDGKPDIVAAQTGIDISITPFDALINTTGNDDRAPPQIVAHAPSKTQGQALCFHSDHCPLAGRETLLRAASPLLATLYVPPPFEQPVDPAKSSRRAKNVSDSNTTTSLTFSIVFPKAKRSPSPQPELRRITVPDDFDAPLPHDAEESLYR